MADYGSHNASLHAEDHSLIGSSYQHGKSAGLDDGNHGHATGDRRPPPSRPWIALLLLGSLVLLTLAARAYTQSPTGSLAWLDLHAGLHHHHYHRIRKRLEQLSQALEGKVVFAGDADFDAHIWNEAAAMEHPVLAMVQVASVEDVSRAVVVLSELQSDYDVDFCLQSGGHNSAGWSACPIILSLANLRPFVAHTPDADVPQSILVEIGPGTTVGDVLAQGLALGYGGIVGSSSSVAMGGWLTGGGIGCWSRRHGLGIDNVMWMQVVLGNGTLVEASNSEHADLFWALRGAGQNNFGVVTSMTYRLYPAYGDLLVVAGRLPHKQAPALLTGLSTTLPADCLAEVNSDEDGLTLGLTCAGKDLASLQQSQTAIAQLLTAAELEGFDYERQSWLENAEAEAQEFQGLLAQDWNGFLMESDNHEKNWDQIIAAVWEMRQASEYCLVDIELWGGAVSEPSPSSSAFYWRDALYTVGVLVLVPKDTKHADKVFKEATKTIDKLWRKHMDLLQGSFVNYAMASLDHAPEITYAKNLERLQTVKAAYDPDDVFRRPQSIPLPKAQKKIKHW